MADFSVPIATNTLSSIDSLIANAPGAMKIGEALGNLPDAYWAGQNQQYLQRNRNAFQSGDLPRTTQGLADALLRIQGTSAAPEYVNLSNLGINQAIANKPVPTFNASPGESGYTPPIQSDTGSPSSARPEQSQQQEPQTEASGTATLRQIAQARGIPVQKLVEATGANPDAPLNFSQRQAAVRALSSSAPPLPQQPPAQQAPAVQQAQLAQAPSPDAQARQQEMTAARADYTAAVLEERARVAASTGTPAGIALGNQLKAEADAQRTKSSEIHKSLLERYSPTTTEKEVRNPAVQAAEEAKVRTAANVAQETKQYEEATKDYKVAQVGQYRLGLINNSINSLGPQWMGSGANFRANAAKTYNSYRDLLPEAARNAVPQFDPNKIASWEDFNKQTMNLGFELARTLGSREAQQIVKQATSSVPGALQTFWGARLVSASMNQAFQRSADYREFLDTVPPGQRLRADILFNKAHPVDEYVAKAASVVPPQKAIDAVRQNPALRPQFDAKYGNGASIGVFGTQ